MPVIIWKMTDDEAVIAKWKLQIPCLKNILLTPVVKEAEEDEIDYESKITVLRYALEQYTNFDTKRLR